MVGNTQYRNTLTQLTPSLIAVDISQQQTPGDTTLHERISSLTIWSRRTPPRLSEMHIVKCTTMHESLFSFMTVFCVGMKILYYMQGRGRSSYLIRVKIRDLVSFRVSKMFLGHFNANEYKYINIILSRPSLLGVKNRIPSCPCPDIF